MGRDRLSREKWAGAGLVAGGILLVAGQLHGGQGGTAEAVLQIQNGHVENRTLQGSLSEEIRRWAAASGKARWLGYAVRAQLTMCCSNDYGNSNHCCGACEGSGKHASVTRPEQEQAKIHLETEEMAVLFRFENDKVDKILVLSLGCGVDADGLDVRNRASG